MTRMLSIETSGTTCGACISVDGVLTSISEVYRPNVHAEQLENCVAATLASAELSIADIDVVAVSAGPGSFTGLRIGLSYVKGLCFDGNIAMFGMDTLETLAWASREVAIASSDNAIVSREVAVSSAEIFIHSIIPSHRDLYYIGSYVVTPSGLEAKHTNGVVELVTLDACRKRTTNGLLCGPGAPFLSPLAISGLTRLSSRFVGLAAWKRMQTNPEAFDDAMTFEPMYRQDWVMASTPAK